MSPWTNTLSRAVQSRALIHPSSRLLRVSSCNHFHLCRTTFSETVLPTNKDKVSPSGHLTKRHIATASPTMPPRSRKRTAADVEAQDNQPTKTADISNLSEAAPNGPRRSSRRISASREPPLTEENPAGNAKMSPAGSKPVEIVAKRIENVNEGAASALRRLEEMETSFKNDIKKRRLQIEQSMVNGVDAGRSMPALKLRGTASLGKSDVVHLDRILVTPEEEKDHPCETQNDDGSEAGDEFAETIKGANRPPAVHSDFLPLPWKGRLGYVSYRVSGGHNCAQILMSHLGLSEYLPAHCQAPCLQFKNMPHSIYPRTSASACRPVATRASDQK